jgi:hypothetical protein
MRLGCPKALIDSDRSSTDLTRATSTYKIYVDRSALDPRPVQKIQVFLREDQKTALKSLSARTGLRQSDLVRQGVDLLLERASRRTTDWREATREAAGLWRERKDLDAISEEVRASFRRRFPAVYPR